MKKYGVSSTGLIMPIIRKGDDLVKIVVDTVLNSIDNIEDRDIIGITESIVARAQGNYVTVDEIANQIKKEITSDYIFIDNPIYSRNRFAMILKALTRGSNKGIIIKMNPKDYVGNDLKNHPFTGLNYDEYYKSIVKKEGKECHIVTTTDYLLEYTDCFNTENCEKYIKEKLGITNYTKIYCGNNFKHIQGWRLDFICKDKCEYGLYGSNKSSEEVLKLFPNTQKAKEVVTGIQAYIYGKTGKKVEVMVYGDGCFKDPVGGIWEFADPVVSPAYTDGLEGTPNEIKIKNFADDKYKDLSGETLSEAIKQEISNKDKDLKGNMASQGTTPRRYTDLLGSLMDLTSGSGDKGTPVVYVKRYFDNYAN